MVFLKGNFEKQITKLPNEVKWCKKCVISNQRPRIIFDENGICSACKYSSSKNNNIDWDLREKELIELLEKYRKNDGNWDVIVPSSGGKDSAYVAHQLRFKYNMNPLTVTWSPLKYTEIGWANMESKINSGLSNILYTPNGNLQKKLARLCFEELGDAFHVFVLGQVCFPFHMALKLGVKLVFYGENGELEYSGDPKLDRPYKPCEDWTDHHFKGSNFSELLNYGIKNKNYLSKEDFSKADLMYYSPPSIQELKKANIDGMYYYGYYHKWIPQENFYYCAENTGFRPNPERTEGTYSKYSSIDDKMDGFHYFLRYVKFGLGRCMEDAAHEIRDGHITREEGIALMRKYEGEFPKKYFQEFLDYLDINDDEFWNIVDSWRLPHLWRKKDNEWELKYPIE